MLKIRNLGVGTLHILTKKKGVHSETLEDTASATPSGAVAYICAGGKQGTVIYLFTYFCTS